MKVYVQWNTRRKTSWAELGRRWRSRLTRETIAEEDKLKTGGVPQVETGLSFV